MEFVVNFRSGSGHAIYINVQPIGLQDLDWIRRSLDLPELDHQLVSQNTTFLQKDESVSIHESIARSSGHFLEKNTITINTPRTHLNQFCSKTILVTKDETNGKIRNVSIKWEVNTPQLIEAWADAGYPIKWTEPEEEAPQVANAW